MKAATVDQAEHLRNIMEGQRSEKPTTLRTVAILSGKGGVGKSNLALGLTCALADRGKRMVLFDADLGMANIDILSGVTAKYNLSHVVQGRQRLLDVLVPFEERIEILPGGVGLKELADLSEEDLEDVIASLTALESRADTVVVDTGAGIHKGVLAFAVEADTTVLLTTPDPTSVRDAYGVIKSLEARALEGKNLFLVVNMVTNESEAKEVAERIRRASMQFLGRAPVYLGSIRKDEHVERAVRMRKPFYRQFPDAASAVCVKKLADELLKFWGDRAVAGNLPKGMKAFFERLSLGFFTGK